MVHISRTRTGMFKPIAIEFLKYTQEQIELVLKLYTKGMSMTDVSDILEGFFGAKISRSQVSALAESFNEIRIAWVNSKLDEYYKVVFCDALYMSVKRGNS